MWSSSWQTELRKPRKEAIMAKTSGGVRSGHIPQRETRDYYLESKRLRDETLRKAEILKKNPLSFSNNNGISMDVVVTKSDIKTIVSKNTTDNKFNALKNKLAQDIKGFIKKSKYEGWRAVVPGKHPETAFFAYYSRKLGGNAYLCMRKIKATGQFKPYAIINERMFKAESGNLHKEKPPK